MSIKMNKEINKEVVNNIHSASNLLNDPDFMLELYNKLNFSVSTDNIKKIKQYLLKCNIPPFNNKEELINYLSEKINNLFQKKYNISSFCEESLINLKRYLNPSVYVSYVWLDTFHASGYTNNQPYWNISVGTATNQGVSINNNIRNIIGMRLSPIAVDCVDNPSISQNIRYTVLVNEFKSQSMYNFITNKNFHFMYSPAINTNTKTEFFNFGFNKGYYWFRKSIKMLPDNLTLTFGNYDTDIIIKKATFTGTVVQGSNPLRIDINDANTYYGMHPLSVSDSITINGFTTPDASADSALINAVNQNHSVNTGGNDHFTININASGMSTSPNPIIVNVIAHKFRTIYGLQFFYMTHETS